MELAPGHYELVVSHEGYKAERRPLTVSTADVTLDVALDRLKYKLTVQATPADSTIELDHSPVEYRSGVQVEPGPYEVVVTRNGYEPHRRLVTIVDADVSVDVTLVPKKYKLTVRAEPADSTIKLTNSPEEYQPGMELGRGRYEVLVTHDGYKPWRSWVWIANADVSVNVALEPVKYKLTVRAEPADSTIKLTNSPEEYQPGMELAVGRYEVVVEHQEYKMERRWVTIEKADVTETIALEPDNPQRPPLGDTTPPHIALDQASIPKTVPPAQSRVTIIGRVTDDSGVAEVAVNGKKAELGADGTFTAEVFLRYGETPIHVTAVDMYGNVGEETLTIFRESVQGRGGKEKEDRPPPQPSIPSGRRLALLIGNAKYKISPLGNAGNDARDMNDTLKKLGFKTTLLINAKRQEMDKAIDAFTRELRQGGAGVFYYAGHGAQIDGQNYLIPVDAPLELAANVKYNSVAANELLERMADAENGLNIIILDACRDNAFTREWRSARRGLAPPPFAQGALIAYSTAPGEVALDGAEGSHNGVYTKYLLKHITQRGLTVEALLKKVRDEVQRETKGQQSPWEASSLVGDFYFAQPK